MPLNEIALPPKKLDISYHEDEDILVINGVHYTGEIFRTLAFPVDDFFYKFERTRDLPEKVTIHRYTHEGVLEVISDGNT